MLEAGRGTHRGLALLPKCFTNCGSALVHRYDARVSRANSGPKYRTASERFMRSTQQPEILDRRFTAGRERHHVVVLGETALEAAQSIGADKRTLSTITRPDLPADRRWNPT